MLSFVEDVVSWLYSTLSYNIHTSMLCFINLYRYISSVIFHFYEYYLKSAGLLAPLTALLASHCSNSLNQKKKSRPYGLDIFAHYIEILNFSLSSTLNNYLKSHVWNYQNSYLLEICIHRAWCLCVCVACYGGGHFYTRRRTNIYMVMMILIVKRIIMWAKRTSSPQNNYKKKCQRIP